MDMQHFVTTPVSSGELSYLLDEFYLLQEAHVLLGVENEGIGSPIRHYLGARGSRAFLSSSYRSIFHKIVPYKTRMRSERSYPKG